MMTIANISVNIERQRHSINSLGNQARRLNVQNELTFSRRNDEALTAEHCLRLSTQRQPLQFCNQLHS
jgi:hypothetical protein